NLFHKLSLTLAMRFTVSNHHSSADYSFDPRPVNAGFIEVTRSPVKPAIGDLFSQHTFRDRLCGEENPFRFPIG
ncbi:MAG: hypothetical protein AAF745_06275, partial [Planctomycetota bacterium]